MKRNKSNQKSGQPSQQAVMQQVSMEAAYHHGPIPPSGELERYNNILPGAADRIIAMAEQQATHRQAIEAIAVKTNARNSTLGVISASVLGIVTIAGGVFLGYSGHEWPGAVLGSAGLIGLASVFIYGTRSSKQERLEKHRSQR